MGRYLWAFRVEGLGSANAATASNKLYRWSWGRSMFDAPSTADPDSLYLNGDGGMFQRWPKELTTAADFRSFEPRVGALTFDIRRNGNALALLLNGTPGRVARLAADLDAADTSVVLDTSGLSGEVLYIGREVIKLGSESPSKTYAVSRAHLETQAQSHAAERGGQLYGSMHPTALYGRLVELLRVPLGSTGYADESVRWRGILRRIGSGNNTTTFGLQIDNLAQLVLQGEIYRRFFQFKIGTRSSRSTLSEELPAAGVGATVEDKAQVLGIVDSKDAALISYRLDTEGRTGAAFIDQPFRDVPLLEEDLAGKSVREFFSSVAEQPSNSASPGDNTLPLSQDPGKAALQIMLTTRGGANDPDYDLRIRALAGGIPGGFVDKDAFERFGERHAAEPCDALHIGHEKPEPVGLKEVVQGRLLAPRGAVIIQGASGLLTVAEMEDALQCGSANALTDGPGGNIIAVIGQRRLLDDTLAEVSLKYNDRPGMEPDVVTVGDDTKEDNLPEGVSGGLDLDARATTSEAAAANMATRIIELWHEPLWEWQLEVLSTANYWPGDTAAVTHAHLTANGARGVSGAVCLVTARREAMDEGGHSIQLTMLYVGELLERNGQVGCIAGGAEVVSWDGGSSTATVEANRFTSPLGPAFTTDAATFQATDKVQLLDEFLAVRDSLATIDAVGPNTLTISGLAVTPNAGDIIAPAPYADATASQRARWAFIADTNNQVDAGLPYVYTS